MIKQWYLVEAQLPARVAKIHAVLQVQSLDEVKEIPLSVTYKGRLFEVVCLERSEQPLGVEVDLGVAPSKDSEFNIHIRPVSPVVAYYWMLHRMIFMWHILSSALRRRIGFFQSLSQSFYQSYRLLSSFRYHYPEPSYSQWLNQYWHLLPRQKKAIQRFFRKKHDLTCTVLIDARSATLEQIQNTLESVNAQEGVRVQSLVCQDSFPSISTDYVLYVKAGCVLRPWAIAWFVWLQLKQSDLLAIYSDNDHYEQLEHWQTPYFKPAWSLELQRSTGYIGDVIWLKSQNWNDLCEAQKGRLCAYRVALELGIKTNNIGHVPAVLWSAPLSSKKTLFTAEKLHQLNQHLLIHRVRATAELDQYGLARVRYKLPDSLPLVSIIIPTRDMFHLLRPCVESILERTTWPKYEIIIVDNQSCCEQTLSYMQFLEQTHPSLVRILQYDNEFNYSAINNFAVRHAQGSVICLLNNDTEIITQDWLDEMISRLLQPEVGVVGARLYYTDGRVQHAGDVVGIGGGATHLHGIIPGDEVGYMFRAVAAQDLSTVTAACLVTHKSLYTQLGGLNEKQLKVAFNDVDYCLRVKQAGYSVIYTPYAELYHHESVSRGPEDTPEKQARAKAEGEYMRQQWPVMLQGDPYYNPNLNYSKPDFSLAKAPSIDWPWS